MLFAFATQPENDVRLALWEQRLAAIAAAARNHHEAAMRSAMALSRLGVPPRPTLAVARALEVANCCDPSVAEVAEERTQITECLTTLVAAVDAIVKSGQGARAVLWSEYGKWACDWASRGSPQLASALLPLRKRLRDLVKKARAAPRAKHHPLPAAPPQLLQGAPPQPPAGGGQAVPGIGGSAAPADGVRHDPGSPNDIGF